MPGQVLGGPACSSAVFVGGVPEPAPPDIPPGRRPHPRDSVIHPELPDLRMNSGVVTRTQQAHALGVRQSTLRPRNDIMHNGAVRGDQHPPQHRITRQTPQRGRIQGRTRPVTTTTTTRTPALRRPGTCTRTEASTSIGSIHTLSIDVGAIVSVGRLRPERRLIGADQATAGDSVPDHRHERVRQPLAVRAPIREQHLLPVLTLPRTGGYRLRIGSEHRHDQAHPWPDPERT